MTVVGVIADTHGLLRDEAVACLKGSDLIIHAGDIGRPEIIPELERIAPVHAIRGNVDRLQWARAFPETAVVEVDSRLIYVLHDLHELDLDPAAAEFAAVISGHSHIPKIDHKDGVLYLNPGSAGPRRFKLPVTVATMTVSPGGLSAELHELGV